MRSRPGPGRASVAYVIYCSRIRSSEGLSIGVRAVLGEWSGSVERPQGGDLGPPLLAPFPAGSAPFVAERGLALLGLATLSLAVRVRHGASLFEIGVPGA